MTPETVAATVARREALLAVVREVLVKRLRLRVLPEQVQPDTPLFGTGLALDSVDAVDLTVGIEERTGVRLPDGAEGRLHLRTVNHLIDFLARAPDAPGQ